MGFRAVVLLAAIVVEDSTVIAPGMASAGKSDAACTGGSDFKKRTVDLKALSRGERDAAQALFAAFAQQQIGRASCRERVLRLV